MLHIILVRHGESFSAFPRDLTDKGKEQAQASAQAVLQRGLHPDLIVTSPLPRTRQTAEVLAAEFLKAGFEVSIRTDEDLHNRRRGIINALSKLDDNIRTVVIVSHEANLGEAAFDLTEAPISFREFAQTALLQSPHNHWKTAVRSSDAEIIANFHPVAAPILQVL